MSILGDSVLLHSLVEDMVAAIADSDCQLALLINWISLNLGTSLPCVAFAVDTLGELPKLIVAVDVVQVDSCLRGTNGQRGCFPGIV